MANPRVFVSSTCYDLSEVRDSLVDFIQSFGFEPVLSDRGDVFYHPDLHTHDACLNEVSNCQLFVLIIGGRFGGEYKADKEKSIVNAEYQAAVNGNVPVFTFVKRNVHSDHFVFQKNKSRKSTVYPSIDKKDHAAAIFEFIDEVRHADVNNGYFPFDFARDISDLLRKQWAGMFFEFLQDRSTGDQFRQTSQQLDRISVAGDKLEDLVKQLYRSVTGAGADEVLERVDRVSYAQTALKHLFSMAKALTIPFVPEPNLKSFSDWRFYFCSCSPAAVFDPGQDPDCQSDSGYIELRALQGGSHIGIAKGVDSRLQQEFETLQRLDQSIIQEAIERINADGPLGGRQMGSFIGS